jgi:hypothetical protein
VSIFRVKELAEQDTSVKPGGMLKHRLTFNGLHGVISQKIVNFINISYYFIVYLQ